MEESNSCLNVWQISRVHSLGKVVPDRLWFPIIFLEGRQTPWYTKFNGNLKDFRNPSTNQNLSVASKAWILTRMDSQGSWFLGNSAIWKAWMFWIAWWIVLQLLALRVPLSIMQGCEYRICFYSEIAAYILHLCFHIFILSVCPTHWHISTLPLTWKE